jgi:hypothetical protein
VLSPTKKETCYNDQTRDLFNKLPPKFNTLLKRLPGFRGSNDRVGRIMATFISFFSRPGTGSSTTEQDSENSVGDQNTGNPGGPHFSGLQLPGGGRNFRARTGSPSGNPRGVSPSHSPSIAATAMSNIPLLKFGPFEDNL